MRIITFEELKPKYGIPYCRDHLRRLAKAGKFPRPREIGPGRIGWLDDEIVAHVDAIAAQPPSNEPAPPVSQDDAPPAGAGARALRAPVAREAPAQKGRRQAAR